MQIDVLLKGVHILQKWNFANRNIKDIIEDSRHIKPRYLFIAIKGLSFDAHTKVEETIQKGASTIIFDNIIDSTLFAKYPKVTFIKVKSSRKALALISSNFHGNPASKLKIIGISGTDGKTTTCNFTYKILKDAGKKVGLISTISAKWNKHEDSTGAHVTTMGPMELHKTLAQMVRDGCEYCVLEVTSHGIHQDRIWGINFMMYAITNITMEHLDYHHSFREYQEIKASLFDKAKYIYLNKHGKSFKKLLELAGSRAQIIDYIQLIPPKLLNENFPGDYNRQNAAIAYAICEKFGVKREKILTALSNMQGLNGRFEYMQTTPFNIIVDFAHTPKALLEILKITRTKTKGKIIVVFGCAGLRDRAKRPKMGEIAQKYANLVVITAEDPRTEKVEDIIEEITSGNIKAGGINNKTFYKIPDRMDAIKFAIKKLAKAGDTVLITGKGHEQTMCFGKEERPWSDQKAVREILKEN